MKKMFACLAEDFGSIELSKKGWNYVGLFLVVLSAIYWLGLCDNGAFFQLTGLAAYCYSAGLWVSRSAWGEWILNEMFDNNYVEFED
jgi:hypothetical protein